MPLSSPGIGSGLDVKSIVDALVKADIAPIQKRHDKTFNDVNTELSAVGQLKNTLATFQSSLHTLTEMDKLYSKKYTLSDKGYVSPELSAGAVKGTYKIEVQNLAQQQSLATGYYANNTTSIGSSGTLQINFGTYSSDLSSFTINPDASPISITIDPDSNSLVSVCDAINNSGSGVTAALVADSQGTRLTISSSQTGVNYAMQISGDISALNYDPTTGVNALTETMAAQNSTTLINGLTVNQSSNELENAISGVTLNLTKAEIGTAITLVIDDDKEQLTNGINDFVKKYNECLTFLTNLTGYNKEEKIRGKFQGDPQFRSLKLNLSRWATAPLNLQNSSIKSLGDLGIKSSKSNGLLEIDQTKFNKAFEAHYAEIGALFAKTATATDNNIQVKNVGAQVPAGTYAVNLTATSGDGITLRGSGDLLFLTLEVQGGTAGSRGNIMVNDGIAVLMDHLVDSYLNKKGDLTQRNEQLTKQLDKLKMEQDRIDIKRDKIEDRYSRQFNALDLLLTNMQSTVNSITQLMNTLPKLKVK